MAFSSHVTMHETWDHFSQQQFYAFNEAWLSEVCRVTKPNGNLLVFGTYHNIYLLGFLLQHVLGVGSTTQSSGTNQMLSRTSRPERSLKARNS